MSKPKNLRNAPRNENSWPKCGPEESNCCWKRFWKTSKKILSAQDDSCEEEEEDDEEESDEKEEEDEGSEDVSVEEEAKDVSDGKIHNGRKPWTEKERQIVTMGFALYGKDPKSIIQHLEDRNRNQLNGFLNRNWSRINMLKKAYPAKTKEQKKTLLAAIERCQDDKSNDNVFGKGLDQEAENI